MIAFDTNMQQLNFQYSFNSYFFTSSILYGSSLNRTLEGNESLQHHYVSLSKKLTR